MKNWTDSCINWNQLPGTEVKRLLATWGKDEKFIARYDREHGFAHTPLAVVPAPAEAVTKPAVSAPAKKQAKPATAKVPSTRQKHTGADGEVKFMEHRNLFIGFWGGRVVVTKRTEAQCREFLKTSFGVES